jgi:hypothetical protein
MMAPSASHPRPSRRAATWWRASLVFAAAIMLVAGAIGAAPALAQDMLTFPARPKPAPRPQRTDGQQQMLVRATQIDYDYTNERVSAVGNVQLYFGNSTLEADRVIYDQKTKRLHAEGNVRLAQDNGMVTHAEIMDLSDDYRDGFVDSLRIDAPEDTRFAASRAERSSGNYTIFHNGVYTACEACKDDPKKPPKWQIKAARIIHDEGEKMLYFEDAKLEALGVPVAYFPYFSAPDPTVKRKSGGVRRRGVGPLLLGAGAGLRRDLHADDHDQARSAAAGRVPPAAAQRLLQHSRDRHFPARQEPLYQRRLTDPGLSRLARQLRNLGSVQSVRQVGVGLGRDAADGQDLLAGLRPVQKHSIVQSAQNNAGCRHVSALHHRPR